MDPAPMDLGPDLAMARGLLESFVLEFTEVRAALLTWNAQGAERGERPQPLPALGDIKGILDAINQTTMNMTKMKKEGAVSRSDFIRIMTEFGRIVQMHVEDEDTRERIKSAWLQVRL